MNGGNPIEPISLKVDKDGFTEFQLWDFMNIYSDYMKCGAEQVIFNNEIYFMDELLRDVF